MNIISNQYLREEKKGSAVYTIEIRNFLRKLSQCRVGSKVSTEMFYVNLSGIYWYSLPSPPPSS